MVEAFGFHSGCKVELDPELARCNVTDLCSLAFQVCKLDSQSGIAGVLVVTWSFVG